jgi:hypothetical protein
MKRDHLYTLRVKIKLSKEDTIIKEIYYNPSTYYTEEQWNELTLTGKLSRMEGAAMAIVNEIVTYEWDGVDSL